jgi:hypothetical protein
MFFRDDIPGTWFIFEVVSVGFSASTTAKPLDVKD